MTGSLLRGFPGNFGVVDAQRLQRGQERRLLVCVYGRNLSPNHVARDGRALGKTTGQGVPGCGAVAWIGLEDVYEAKCMFRLDQNSRSCQGGSI